MSTFDSGSSVDGVAGAATTSVSAGVAEVAASSCRWTYRSTRSPGSNRAECGGACGHLKQTSALNATVDRAQVVEKIGKISRFLAAITIPLFG